jgi:PAS domain S-box-containing protein
MATREELQKRVAELEDQMERYHLFSEITGEGLVLHEQGKVFDVNPAILAMFGYAEAAEVVGKGVLQFIAPEAHETAAQYMQAGHTHPLELPALRKDGTVFPMETSACIYEVQGHIIRGVSARDITERKQAEAERTQLQQEIIDAQQRAIAELSTPVIPIMDRIIVMPLVGSIDSLRARDVTRSLLAGISHHRAKVVILDVTGVAIMDTGVVNHLNKTIQAARLKGARTIVTGLSDSVAEAIVDLGIDWSGIETLSDLRTGLTTALGSLGVKLTQNGS